MTGKNELQETLQLTGAALIVAGLLTFNHVLIIIGTITLVTFIKR